MTGRWVQNVQMLQHGSARIERLRSMPCMPMTPQPADHDYSVFVRI